MRKLQEETPQADINQDNVALAGVLQGAVGHAVDTPVFALLLAVEIVETFYAQCWSCF